MKLTIPSHLTIGDRDITIKLKKNLFHDTGNLGGFSPARCEIELDSIIATEKRGFHVFIHEVLEAINIIYCLNISHRILDILDVGISQALQTMTGTIIEENYKIHPKDKKISVKVPKEKKEFLFKCAICKSVYDKCTCV